MVEARTTIYSSGPTAGITVHTLGIIIVQHDNEFLIGKYEVQDGMSYYRIIGEVNGPESAKALVQQMGGPHLPEFTSTFPVASDS